MKKLALIAMMLISVSTIAQHFGTSNPTDYEAVTFQVDPSGTFDKGGPNFLVSFQAVDFGWLEWEVQTQMLWTPKYSNVNNMLLDYIDIQAGPGVLIPIGDRWSITGGMHGGMVIRPGNKIYPNTRGGMIWGFTGNIKVWIGDAKRIGFIMSAALDDKPELKQFKPNVRGGFMWNWD